MAAGGIAKALCLVLLLAVAALGDADDRWLEPGADVRRTITCEPASTSLPGDDMGVVTFYTGGLAAADGKDVRVFTASGEPALVPHRVIMAGPGDRLRVAFATAKGVRKYHLYYGNAKAEAPAAGLDIRRGVLYEVRSGRASDAEKVDQVRRAFAQAQPQGAAFVDNIFFGHNPFGPSENFISRFTGHMVVDRPGEYRIATTSDDCSFVLIDDKLCVEWGGVHGAVGDARYSAPVMLSRGMHKLEYWHAQGGGEAVAEAAWLRPGELRYEVIPAAAFAPVAVAALSDIQIRGRRISPDFCVTIEGESFLDDFYPVRVAFQNSSSPGSGENMTYRWDFGDGQTSAQKEPTHVYLQHGTYKVRLTVTWGPQRAEITNRVAIERNWWKQSANRVEPLEEYAQRVGSYVYERLDPEGLGRAVDLFARVRNRREQVRALEALVFKVRGVPEEQMMIRAGELVALYRRAKLHAEAVKAWQRAEAAVRSTDRKAAAAIGAAKVTLWDLDHVGDAEKEYRRVLADYAKASGRTLRDVHIGLGDVACRRGDTEAAMAAYRQAERIPLGGLAARNPTLRVSSLARYVEEYTRTRDFDAAEQYLETWYDEFPSHRVTGQAPLLEARLRFAQEHYEAVMRIAGELVGVNRDSPFAADALFLSAEAALKLDRGDDARRSLAQIVDDYPEHARREEAAALLKKLGGPLSEKPGS